MLRQRIRAALARHQVRGVLYLLLAHLLDMGLGLLTSILIFRTLGPEGMGQFTLAVSVIGLLGFISEFGLRDAAVNYMARYAEQDPDQAWQIAHTFLLLKTALAMVAFVLVLGSAGFINRLFYPDLPLTPLIHWGALKLISNALLGVLLAILEARRRFQLLALLGLIQGVSRAGLVACLFWGGQLNPLSLLLAEAVMPLLALLYGLRFLPPAAWRRYRPWGAQAGRMLHFSKWVAVAAFASIVLMKVDVLLLSYYHTPVEVGLYAAALALINRLNLVKGAVLTTAYPEACRQTTRPAMLRYLRHSLLLTASLSLLFLPLFPLGGYLIGWLYGSAYHAATVSFIVLLGSFLLGFNVQPLAYLLYPLNRLRWVAGRDVAQLLLMLLLSMLLIPPYGGFGAALATLLTQLSGAAISLAVIGWSLRK